MIHKSHKPETQLRTIPNIKELFEHYSIKDVQFDSRDVQDGDAFFAINGVRLNGNIYIEDAFKHGARIVFTDDQSKQSQNVFYTENIRESIAEAASYIYPKLPKHLVAVTGTNGKTSITSYSVQILHYLDIPASAIGTIGVLGNYGNEMTQKYGANLTTANPVSLRKMLHELSEKGVDTVCFEASSHGLHQKRLGNIKVQAAAFSSFSQDHLDYHNNMEEYLAAKLELFSKHLEGVAIIASEINYKQNIVDFFNANQINYLEIGKNGDIELIKALSSIEGQKIIFRRKGKIYEFYTKIIGSYQAVNILIAAELVAKITNIKYEEIVEILPKLQTVSGRLEKITTNEDFAVFVDYAHTPEAIENSLIELSKLKKGDGKLYIIFGCGGNRDVSKRSIMGKIATFIADFVIVTDDNPREEDPSLIRKEVMKYATNAKEFDDRRKAIETTVAILKKDDILLISGKGHENYQIIGTTKYPFSDIQIAMEAIQKCKK